MPPTAIRSVVPESAQPTREAWTAVKASVPARPAVPMRIQFPNVAAERVFTRSLSAASGGCCSPEFSERPPGDVLGHPGLVQVLRDSAEEERPAGAEQKRGVDVLRTADDAFIE